MKKNSFRSISIALFSLISMMVLFYGEASAEFSNMRAEWQPSCSGSIPHVPNKPLDLSWDYVPPQGANVSNICHVTVTGSQGVTVWNTDIWCRADVIEYSGDALSDGGVYSWVVGRLDTNGNLIEESTDVCQFQVYEPGPLPSNRSHIRLFRNFPVVQGGHNDIVDFGYDLSFTDGTSEAPDHIALPYDLATEFMTPYLNDPNINSSQYRKANKLKEWWCTEKLQKPLNECNLPDNWFCDDVTVCDIPEHMFMHFKVDTTVSLPLGNPGYYPGSGTTTVKGWDPTNDIDGSGEVEVDELPLQNPAATAINRQQARVPSYYWGDFWRYLNPDEPVAHRSCFAMAVGNPDYKEFMSIVYVPYVLSIKENADGIYLDDATAAYYKIWQVWAGTNGFVEYNNKGQYLTENMKLMKAIKENISSDKIVIGNGWSEYPHIIEGNQKETAFDISMPYEGFNRVFSISAMNETIRAEQDRGIITASQFNPANTYDDNYAEGGVQVPNTVTRSRDQIYGLASYYLIAGDTTYFSYAGGPYYDWQIDELFIDATGVDVGKPEGSYYIRSGSEEHGQGVNLITNGDFESADVNNDPAGWVINEPQYVEVASEEDCALDINGTAQGSCAKINRDTSSYAYNTQWVTLDSNTKYTLTGYIRTENVNNTYGANIFTYNFEIAGMTSSSDDHLDCGAGPGTNGWKQFFCTFTTETMPAPGNHNGQYGNGSINFRIQGGTGTAWFDNIELRQGVSRIVLARNYSKSLILVRPMAGYNRYFDLGYEDPITYSLDGYYFPVNSDGSLGAAINEVTLNNGEAAILIKDNDNDGYPASSLYGESDCDDNNAAINPAANDTNCDGVDENCTGIADEGYVPTPTVCGVGACASTGQLICVNGSTPDTCTPGTPGTEGLYGDPTCSDSTDNDCDGLTDTDDAYCRTVDLIVTAISNSATAVSGGSFTVTDTVFNQGGTGTGSGFFFSHYYLSTDSLKDDSDTDIGNRKISDPIAPSGSSNGTKTFNFPPSITPGIYYLLVCADYPETSGRIAESDETNNCLVSQTTVQVN